MTRVFLFVAAALVTGLSVFAGCVREGERPNSPITSDAPAGATPASTVFAASEATAGGLLLQITSLPKESVVRTNTVPISGITSPGGVVSVNGVLVDVDAGGRFTSTVSLQERPNLVEVVASDFKGNQLSSVLTVIYVP